MLFALQAIWNEVREGGSLAGGIRRCGEAPQVQPFSDYVVGLVDVAEETGDVDQMFVRISGLSIKLALLARQDKEVDKKVWTRMLEFEMLNALIKAGDLPVLHIVRIIEQYYPRWKKVGDEVEKGSGLGSAMASADFYSHDSYPVSDGIRDGNLEERLAKRIASLEQQAFGF